MSTNYYITTPIYYVNDRPTIGHCYTTVVADAAARLARLAGREVFFLTGTDEHAEKVETSAAEHGATPLEWADRNAAEFARAFALMGCTNDDFIRTSEARHKNRVVEYISRLLQSGDVYLGDYEGWYDPGQEEYVTETAAREGDYKSAVSGKELIRKREKNYFFRLSRHQAALEAHIRANPGFLLPEARRNETLGRIAQGLQDVPISRAVTDEERGRPAGVWGVLMPGDGGHRVYVWIDALFNYLSAVDTAERRPFWPASVHVLGKDILWFHAVIWPAMLMALGEELPRCVYAHAWWVREGRKMSKSLGNFITIELLETYAERYSLDALRWYLLTQGPLGANDADFSHAKFVEVYNADLANGIGNCASRVSNMIGRYFDGRAPEPKDGAAARGGGAGERDWPEITAAAAARTVEKLDRFDIAGALGEGIALVRAVDGYINQTEPFKLAKQLEGGGPQVRERLAEILYNCAETLRIASLLVSPAMPHKMADLSTRWGCAPAKGTPLAELARWGGLAPGTPIEKGEALFMRADPADPAPTAPAAG